MLTLTLTLTFSILLAFMVAVSHLWSGLFRCGCRPSMVVDCVHNRLHQPLIGIRVIILGSWIDMTVDTEMPLVG
jgi:hypothetical protein